jgi:Ser/Thr protein kinase RdoA (MazF antagonist)
MDGPRAGQAVFFDFDESGPGYLAYDLAVFLFNCVLYDRKDHASWRAFIEGYRFIRQLSRADFEAAHLFVPFVGILLAGEYASRIHEWGRQAAVWALHPHAWCSGVRFSAQPELGPIRSAGPAPLAASGAGVVFARR